MQPIHFLRINGGKNFNISLNNQNFTNSKVYLHNPDKVDKDIYNLNSQINELVENINNANTLLKVTPILSEMTKNYELRKHEKINDSNLDLDTSKKDLLPNEKKPQQVKIFLIYVLGSIKSLLCYNIINFR